MYSKILVSQHNRASLPTVLFGILLLAFTSTSCSPSLHPLYKDYQHPFDGHIPIELIEKTLIESGWEIVDSPSSNTITTAERTIRNWLLYKVTVYVEVVPISPKHARLLIHPYRVFITGSRSKIPFLQRGIRRGIIRDLDRAFESHTMITVRPE